MPASGAATAIKQIVWNVEMENSELLATHYDLGKFLQNMIQNCCNWGKESQITCSLERHMYISPSMGVPLSLTLKQMDYQERRTKPEWYFQGAGCIWDGSVKSKFRILK